MRQTRPCLGLPLQHFQTPIDQRDPTLSGAGGVLHF